MKSAQHEETGVIINLDDDAPIPRRYYEVPNCTHQGELSNPSRALGSNGPLERHCLHCGTLIMVGNKRVV